MSVNLTVQRLWLEGISSLVKNVDASSGGFELICTLFVKF